MKEGSIYPEVLNILKTLLENSGNTYWSNWIEKDINLWNESKSVKHHLSAYGGMGSINDLYVANYSLVGVWENNIFDQCKSLAYKLAENRGKGGVELVDLSPKRYRKILSGSRCLDCGYGVLSKVDIEDYIANTSTSDFIIKKINDKKINEILNVDEIIDSPNVIELRNELISLVKNSDINVSNTNNSWFKPCPKCNSENIAAYRWDYKVTEAIGKIAPSKDNLRLKNSTDGFFDKIKRRLLG